MKYENTGTEQDSPRTRRGFRLHPEVLEIVERRKASGEYETYSDFVEDAIVFYNGVLDADENRVTGRQGVFNMGRNITFKVVVPVSL